MATKIISRSELFFAQLETNFAQIPNSGGTATLAGSDAVRGINLTMNRATTSLVRRDKTGSRSMTPGTAGRKSASWNYTASLVTSGVAGTAPDADPIHQATFGQAPTSKTGTSTISAATNANPIVLTTSAPHGCSDYDCVRVSGVTGNTAANGFWCVKATTTTSLELIGSQGNGAYVSGGTVTRTALVYKLHDTNLQSLSLWSARKPFATAMQRCCFGAVSAEATYNLGEDIATFQSSGPAYWMNDNKNFASATLEEKGGLLTFPDLSLLTPVTAGGPIAGFKGLFVINGEPMKRIRQATVKVQSSVELPADTFANGYPDLPEADERNVNLSFSMYEDDTTAQAALEQASHDKTGVDAIVQIGNTASSVVVLVLKGVQLASPTRDDGGRSFVLNYGESRAYGSSITAVDEVALWML